LVVPLKALSAMAASTLVMWKTEVKYIIRFAAVPILPSFSKVSLPITNGIVFHPRYRSSGAAADTHASLSGKEAW
jgi:hypothetical protein